MNEYLVKVIARCATKQTIKFMTVSANKPVAAGMVALKAFSNIGDRLALVITPLNTQGVAR